MKDLMTAVERVEHIRAARAEDEDIRHLLRMYDESLRVNVGIIAENTALKRAAAQHECQVTISPQTAPLHP